MICHIVNMGSVIHNMCIYCACVYVCCIILLKEREREDGEEEREQRA